MVHETFTVVFLIFQVCLIHHCLLRCQRKFAIFWQNLSPFRKGWVILKSSHSWFSVSFKILC